MIWKASGGVSEEVDALDLLPLLLGVEVDACSAASASVSIGTASPSSSSSGSLTLILLQVSLLIAEGVDMGLMS